MRVQFLKNTSAVKTDNLPTKTLVIFRDGFGYQLPRIPGAEFIEFLEYKNKYMLFEPEFIIVIGLNRIITPSNRCDMVNEYLQTMTPNIPKICIDNAPFIGEPWRLWFHYSIANCGRFNITYSFAIETEWEKWFYRDVPDCRLSRDNIRLAISDTISDIEPMRSSFEFFDIFPLDEDYYVNAKKHVFDKYDTPKMLINNLLKLANKHFGIDLSYDSYLENKIIKLPDIGIYRFVAEENERRRDIYNEVIKYGNENLHR